MPLEAHQFTKAHPISFSFCLVRFLFGNLILHQKGFRFLVFCEKSCEMEYCFEKARIDNKFTAKYVAERLDISRPAITNWEKGHRLPNIEKLIQLSELYGVTTDYLLGLSDKKQIPLTGEIDKERLFAFHDMPVWLAGKGWGLINVIQKAIIFSDLTSLPISDIAQPVFSYPPAFAMGLRGVGTPIRLDELEDYKRVWVEPISQDITLQTELRGWYHVNHGKVQNKLGQSFYFDVYGSKWIAFQDCFENADE